MAFIKCALNTLINPQEITFHFLPTRLWPILIVIVVLHTARQWKNERRKKKRKPRKKKSNFSFHIVNYCWWSSSILFFIAFIVAFAETRNERRGKLSTGKFIFNFSHLRTAIVKYGHSCLIKGFFYFYIFG